MSLWHVALMAIGIYEFRTHRSKLAKVLAAGMIAFHADAAISDALDTPKCLSRYLLEKATGTDFGPSEYQTNDADTSQSPVRDRFPTESRKGVR
jgi:hypothetical protein